MTPSPEPAAPEPRQLKVLRLLVTTLMVVMILGVVVIVGLLVTRLTADRTPPLPETVSLPDGARAQAVTMGPGWYAVVTEDQRILIFDADTGALRQSIQID
ncbi:DUF6476 family protein [Pseudodonghicola sp. IC7]|uniref:DUF6476 family protein n=1 Tax=Pseudodonghicola flavimaris TaxID=3050036 RepID=A0ABT7F552_9RHOB|nr:DUF6476 family protein [Pseudodonghicola flavimaris]